jgi:hypothetical protein
LELQFGVLPNRVKRLSEQERELIRAALAAVAEGPYFPESEFAKYLGADKSEVAAVLKAWPEATVAPDWEPDPERLQAEVVHRVLDVLLWSPHVTDAELPGIVGTDSDGLWELLDKWGGPVFGPATDVPSRDPD